MRALRTHHLHQLALLVELLAVHHAEHFDIEVQVRVGRDRAGRLVAIAKRRLDPEAIFRALRHQLQPFAEALDHPGHRERGRLLRLVEGGAVEQLAFVIHQHHVGIGRLGAVPRRQHLILQARILPILPDC